MRATNLTMKADKRRLMHLVKLLSLAAAVMLVMTMLLACGGEDEDIGNGGSGDSTATAEPGTTPTNDSGTDSTPTTGTGTPTVSVEGIAHPTGADESILIISYEGGFLPATEIIKRLPLFVLLGDGTIVTEGPQIQIFPQPALPNLQATQISEEGIQQILEAAKAAGLLDGDADYPIASIADAANTVFTLTADGKTTRVSAYALSEGEFSSPDLTPEQVAARKKLSDFLAQVTDLNSFLPAEAIISEEQLYKIERFQTVFLPTDAPTAPQAPEDIEQQELEWPLATPISELEAFAMMPDQGMVCGVVEGADADTLRELLGQANQLTLWHDAASPDDATSATPGADTEATQYYLFLRPLLPGEEGCQLDMVR